MNVIRWFRQTFPQDDFADDWYGWLTNQVSHIGLGLLLAVGVSGITLLTLGEFPDKRLAWLACALLYLGLELLRGWSGWDTVEDWLFVACYGAGGAFILFTEVEPGLAVLFVDFGGLPWVLALPAIHLAFGAYLRW